MIKISFMTFACPDYSFDQVVDLAVRHSYQGIEFRTDSGHAHGVEVSADAATRVQMRHKMADAGIEACCLATSLQFVNEQAVEQAPALIDLAAELLIPGLRVFCGPLPEGVSLKDAIKRAAANIAKVADRAQAAGVQLWLETHDSVSLAVDAGQIVRLADHPAVAINWDNMHPYRNGESLETTWEAISPYIQHTHFHDSVNEPGAPIITPFGQGGLPVQKMFDLLQSVHYIGYYSGEWFGEQMGADADTSLAAHRDGLLALEAAYHNKQ
ncbi:MAG: sugar phosphate isomerase/epimerase [Chloroflexi bacterium]|nr:sugar phosphate isomerase/epimerase [Chloroflexota bacterium]